MDACFPVWGKGGQVHKPSAVPFFSYIGRRTFLGLYTAEDILINSICNVTCLLSRFVYLFVNFLKIISY